MKVLNLEMYDGFTISKNENIEFLKAKLSEDKNIARIVQGQYCLAVSRLERNLGARSKYALEFYFDFVGKPDAPTSRERIAFWFSGNFPKIFTLSSEFTEDRIRLFLDYKDWVIRFSRVFSEKWDNPLAEDLENGYINQIEHDLIRLKAKLYQNLWDLIYIKWKSIELSLSRDPNWSFESPIHFFQEFMEIDFRGELDRFWKSRYEVNTKDFKRLSTLQRKRLKGSSLTRFEEDEWQRYEGTLLNENIWWGRLSEILEDAVIRKVDPTVEFYVKTIDATVDAICKLYQKAACDQISGFRSVTWLDGREHIGIWHKSMGVN